MSPAALAAPRDPTWYSAKELDELPRPLRPIRPLYFASGTTQGRVVLALLIDESGTVTDASVLEAEPVGELAKAALAAGRAAWFRPGSRGGRVVKSKLLLELTLRSNEDSGRP